VVILEPLAWIDAADHYTLTMAGAIPRPSPRPGATPSRRHDRCGEDRAVVQGSSAASAAANEAFTFALRERIVHFHKTLDAALS